MFEQQLAKHFRSLPKKDQEYILSPDVAEALMDISGAFALNDEARGILRDEVYLVLLRLSKRDELPSALNRLTTLDEETRKKIYARIEADVFTPFYGAQASVATSQSPSISPSMPPKPNTEIKEQPQTQQSSPPVPQVQQAQKDAVDVTGKTIQDSAQNVSGAKETLPQKPHTPIPASIPAKPRRTGALGAGIPLPSDIELLLEAVVVDGVEYTREEVRRAYRRLSPALQRALTSERFGAALDAIATEMQLSADAIETVGSATALVVLGFLPRTELIAHLKKHLGAEAQAETIAGHINEKIFLPIRALLDAPSQTPPAPQAQKSVPAPQVSAAPKKVLSDEEEERGLNRNDILREIEEDEAEPVVATTGTVPAKVAKEEQKQAPTPQAYAVDPYREPIE